MTEICTRVKELLRQSWADGKRVDVAGGQRSRTRDEAPNSLREALCAPYEAPGEPQDARGSSEVDYSPPTEMPGLTEDTPTAGSGAANRLARRDSAAGWLLTHLHSCEVCRSEAEELRRLDRTLERGLSRLCALVETPSEEKVAETLRRVHEVVPELQLIRRVRRPLRIILWGTFYALMLVACVALAALLYKALRGH